MAAIAGSVCKSLGSQVYEFSVRWFSARCSRVRPSPGVGAVRWHSDGTRCPAGDRRTCCRGHGGNTRHGRSEEHTSELQSLMRISYAVFCLKKKYSEKLA